MNMTITTITMIAVHVHVNVNVWGGRHLKGCYKHSVPWKAKSHFCFSSVVHIVCIYRHRHRHHVQY